MKLCNNIRVTRLVTCTGNGELQSVLKQVFGFQLVAKLSKNLGANSESSQTSKIEAFAIIDNGWKPLTIFAKISTLDIWLGSEYASKIVEILIILNL